MVGTVFHTDNLIYDKDCFSRFRFSKVITRGTLLYIVQ